MLREVAGGFGGAAWTFAKGRPELGETDEAAALREVREELGAVCEIIGALDGWFVGATTATGFFVMRAVGPLQPHDSETASVRWVSLHDARHLVTLSESAIVRARDLAVLDAVESAG